MKQALTTYLTVQLRLPVVVGYIEDNYGMMPIYIVNEAMNIMDEFILELNCTEQEDRYEVELWQESDGDTITILKTNIDNTD